MILLLVEHDSGEPEEASLEAAALARGLPGADPLAALVIGHGGDSTAAAIGGHGVATVHVVKDGRFDRFAPGAWARALDDLAAKIGASGVIAAATDRGNDVMARLAARRGLPLAANCVAASPAEPAGPPGLPGLAVTRIRWGGSLLEEAVLHSPIPLLTVLPHAVAAVEVAPGAVARVQPFEPELDPADLAVHVVEHVPAPGGGISLADARVVVSGGRGVGSAAGFGALEELAALLGGAVGCSRAVTSAGWRPHTDQVGQTGTKVAPDVYIACGISGATQHMAGCKGAKRILAVNTDPEAPIMAGADYAVVGDVAEVVPAITAEIRKQR